jgi:hypothetical protein
VKPCFYNRQESIQVNPYHPQTFAAREIVCKAKENSPEEEIESDFLSFLLLTLSNGDTIDFECIPTVFKITPATGGNDKRHDLFPLFNHSFQ